MFNFGENLRKLRKDKHLTLKYVASKVGVSDSIICRYEKNEVSPPLDAIIKLSGILNISLDELCGLQPKGTLSLHGMTDEQIEIIKTLSDAFRVHNASVRKAMTPERFEILGQIVAEFTK